MQLYNLTLDCLRHDPAAHLNVSGHRQILAPILIALAKQYLDSVEWLLHDRTTTYIARLPQDIRQHIIEPYLWVGNALCGIPYRDGFIYGVEHGIHRNFDGTIAHYSMGLLHRVGGAALMRDRVHMYFQYGRPHREYGPTRVAPTSLNYLHPRPLLALSSSGLRAIWFRRELSVNRILSIDGIIWRTFNYRLLIIGGVIRIDKGARYVSFMYPAFSIISEVLIGYFRSYDIDGEIAREWALSQAISKC